ncbi:hypothetical protein [Corynebacterium liangguodongii]|uniref:Uncharacterized protein n=1 Tax=Corynebacterium liangguodongii TaxID=2079535 RepID=A0A2S0WEH8_9CORY|nr:hypothetical protein [Corynebacterium liangguodongii]AWB84134.1 hypothetical protein C3E79_06285 [Corynebacterium liangguodongii]PWC00145.1 hypothetical protein DF219_02925 [Corynebacterium liangguodongii]
MTKKYWTIAAATLAAFGAALPAAGAAAQEPAPEVSAPAAVTIHDALKPGAEIAVSSPCAEGDAHATLETSFGATAEMTPAADAGELVGYVTAPEQIGPGPADGYHTATVTCDSGESATVAFVQGGNDEAQAPR